MLTVILTGGQSRRMGRDKALLPLEGQPMSLALAERYAELGPVAFSVDRKGRFPVGGFVELVDRWPGQGPINGLISAFLDTGEDVVFLTATDMPGGSAEAVRPLLAALGEHDACLYGQEPLFAVYRRSCLAAALDCMEEGRRSLKALLERLDVQRLPMPGEGLFVNLNTPEEYRSYEK